MYKETKIWNIIKNQIVRAVDNVMKIEIFKYIKSYHRDYIIKTIIENTLLRLLYVNNKNYTN